MRPPIPAARLALAASLAAVMATASGCSGARVTKLESSLVDLKDEISELRRGQAAQRVQFDEFRNRLVMLQDKLDSQRVQAARARAVQHRADEPPPLPRVVVPPARAVPSPAPAPTGGR